MINSLIYLGLRCVFWLRTIERYVRNAQIKDKAVTCAVDIQCVILYVKLGFQGQWCSQEVSWTVCGEGSGIRLFALQGLLSFQ